MKKLSLIMGMLVLFFYNKLQRYREFGFGCVAAF